MTNNEMVDTAFAYFFTILLYGFTAFIVLIGTGAAIVAICEFYSEIKNRKNGGKENG